MTELPPRPRYIFCATDLEFGVNWVFDSGAGHPAGPRMGDYQHGYAPLPAWPVVRAIGASSCFPPAFAPMRIDPAGGFEGGDYRGPNRDALMHDIRLTAGGVYDNLGLESIWKDHAVVMVSDGGGVMEAETDSGFLWLIGWEALIATQQSRIVRKRWLISNFLSGQLRGAYWGIAAPRAAITTTRSATTRKRLA